jgi:hypothetical protein
MSRKYIARWDMPSSGAASKPVESAHGNVCVVEQAHGASKPLACAEVRFFPGVYAAIGVDDNSIIRWQDEHGFHSGGVAPTGALLAPGYPVFSRLAWTLIEPVYLQGDELSALRKNPSESPKGRLILS